MTPPTPLAVIWRDFLASALTRVAVGVWGFVLVFELIGRLGGAQAAEIHAWGSGNLLGVALVLSGIATPLVVWRVVGIRRAFRLGHRTPATVVAVEVQPTMRAVWVEYRAGGEVVRRRNAVRHSGRPLPEIGQPVTVFVAPDDPRIGFVAELYLD